MTGDSRPAEAGTGPASLMIDVRPLAAYGRAHVKGAVPVPFRREGFVAAVRERLGDTASVVLMADNTVVAQLAADELRRGGIAVAALFTSIDAARTEGLPVVEVTQVTVDHVAQAPDAFTVIDVREPYEWRTGTVPGALRIPLGHLPERVGELEPAGRYALVCAHGNRSQVAAGWLADRGFSVVNVQGGMALWLDRGFAVEA
jgi:rhodanese-related sulfurtransferase